MIYPSISDLTGGKFNRYTLCVATAKCARMVTDEYVKQREYADKVVNSKETDKSIASLIKREYRDEKAVKNAINRIYNGEFRIIDPDIPVEGEHLRDGYRKTIRGAVYGDDELLADDVTDEDDELLDEENDIKIEDDEITEPLIDDDIIEALIPDSDEDN